MTTVGVLAEAVAEFAPPSLAEQWDNVGLLLGDPAATVQTVVCCLDLSLGVAAEVGPEPGAVVAFHPPIFTPLPRVVAGDPLSGVVWQTVRAGHAVIATHTGLDSARPGTSDFLAEALGLTAGPPLLPRDADSPVKVVVFCPATATAAVAAAMAAAGAGTIGDYAECSFRATGTGSFRPLAGAEPAIGEVGRLESVAEDRLELLVPRARLAAVLAAMRAAHPYQEVAHDIYALESASSETGLGRLAELPEPLPLGEFAQMVGRVCASDHLRLFGEPTRLVRRVALLGGSGASHLADAAQAGADVYVTGDVRHHDAREALARGLALVDPGHAATERFAVERTARFLTERFPAMTVKVSTVRSDPFERRLDG